MNFLQKLWNIIEVIVRFFLQRLLHMEESRVQGFLQFVKFGIVGVTNTVVSYLIYLLSLKLFQRFGWLPKADYLIAQVIAFFLSVLWSFYWNNRFVFTKEEGQTRSLWYTLLKTYISYAFTGLFLNTILSILWVNVFGISKEFAPIINLLVSVPLNFIINKFWAFRTETSKTDD